MLAPEAGGDGTLFEGVEDGVGRAEELLQHDVHAAEDFGQEEVFGRFVEGAGGGLGTAEAEGFGGWAGGGGTGWGSGGEGVGGDVGWVW